MGLVKLTPTIRVEKANIDTIRVYSGNALKTRIRNIKKENPELLNDETRGKKIATVIFLKTGTVILVPTSIDTINKRYDEAEMG